MKKFTALSVIAAALTRIPGVRNAVNRGIFSQLKCDSASRPASALAFRLVVGALLAVAVLVGAAGPGPAHAITDISGDWNVTFTGSLTGTCDLPIAQDGSAWITSAFCLTGTLTLSGPVDSETGAFSGTGDHTGYPGVTFSVAATASSDDDSLSAGSYTGSPGGYSGTFSGIRVPDLSVNSIADDNTRDSVLTLREAMLIATGGLIISDLAGGECARVTASTFSVTCSTTQLMGADYADTIGFDEITFPTGTPATITLSTTPLPALSTGHDAVRGGAGVIVDGVTKAFNCFVISGDGSDNNTIEGIEIKRCLSGVRIENGSDYNSIGGTTAAERNVISANTNGVTITGAGTDFNTVEGNYIGLNAAGTAAAANATGVSIEAGAQFNTVGGSSAASRNVISGNSPGNGVRITGAGTDFNTVEGNYIGLNAAGTAAAANTIGVRIEAGGQLNTVGGTSGDKRNVVSGNVIGVFIGVGTTTNTVEGNYIGADTTGNAGISNSGGGVVVAGSSNTIGGTSAAARNVISGNGDDGVELGGGGSGNVVKGNFIGLGADGVTLLGNAVHGVHISGTSGSDIGGPGVGEANTIADNGGDGVFVAAGIGNDIRGNAIYANSGLGIDLAPDGVTINDVPSPPALPDTDAGANDLQNFPEMFSALNTNGQTIIAGQLKSTPSTAFTIDGFSSVSCDAAGNGEGATYLGPVTRSTDPYGTGYGAVATALIPLGASVTTTATGPSGTSEFSNCVTVEADSNDDGVADSIDTGGGTFSDIGLGGGGTTAGSVTSVPSGTIVSIVDAPNPAGVYVAAAGTAGTADVTFDCPSMPEPVLHISSGDFVIQTCGSSITEVYVGPVTLSVGTISATLPSETSTTITQSGSEYVVTTAADNVAPVVIGGLAVAAGDSVTVVDIDGDGEVGQVDTDDDGDLVSDVDEGGCGSDALNSALRPERIDGAFAGVDDDGDTLIDEALPAGAAAFDCDGDGYTGTAEAHVFGDTNVRDQDPCGTNGWPSDFVAGGLPDSTNRVNVLDIVSFIAPVRRLNTSPPEAEYADRWDLVPGAGLFPEVINVTDLTALIAGPSGNPPMLGGVRAFNGPSCPWPG